MVFWDVGKKLSPNANGECMAENCSRFITVRNASDVVWKSVGAASNFSGDNIMTSVLSGVQGSLFPGGELEYERRLDEEDETWLSLSLDWARCRDTMVETRKFPCGKTSAEERCLRRLVRRAVEPIFI